jgi:hypothetical protein
LLPAAGAAVCGAVVTVLVEPLFVVVALESSPEVPSSDVEVVVPTVPVVDFDAKEALCATPAMRPTVTAPAAAATP